MRVAVFTNTYYPTLNGVAHCVDAYRRGLEARGHEVYIFAPCPAEYDPAQDRERVYRFPAVATPGDWDYDIAVPYSRPVMKALRETQFDIVHTQHPLWVGVWGGWYARWAGLPLVTTIHTEYALYAHIVPLPEPLVEAYLRNRVTTYCNKCQVVTTPAASTRDRLLDQGVTTPIEILPNPIELSKLAPPEPDKVRSRYHIPKEAFVMGFVGRLAPEKNLSTVLAAAEIVARQVPGARFLMVGEGTESRNLRQQARELGMADRVVFAGAVEHEQVVHYHAAMDVFVTASGSETQPLAYTEAMAVGTPVVAVRAPGAEDMITHGENGLLSEPQEGAQGLARQILRLVEDPTLRLAIAARAREQVKRYDLGVVTERLLGIYETAMERYQLASR